MLRHSPPLSPGYDRCNARRTNIEPIRQCPVRRRPSRHRFRRQMRAVFFIRAVHPAERSTRSVSPAGRTVRTGQRLYRHFGLDQVSYETYVLLQDGKAYFRSEASIRIVDGLGGAWSLFATLARLVPASLRDALYNVIARNRLRWFGAREQCYLPEPSQADRFLS